MKLKDAHLAAQQACGREQRARADVGAHRGAALDAPVQQARAVLAVRRHQPRLRRAVELVGWRGVGGGGGALWLTKLLNRTYW